MIVAVGITNDSGVAENSALPIVALKGKTLIITQVEFA